jgi:hypothetical protein
MLCGVGKTVPTGISLLGPSPLRIKMDSAEYPASSVLWPSPTPSLAATLVVTFGDATPHQSRASPNYPDHPPYMPCSLPRWTGTGACWFLPCPRGLPRFGGGSASTFLLSRPAQASFTLRPARLLTHLTVGFIARLHPDRFPDSGARKLSSPTNNYLSGSFPHW